MNEQAIDELRAERDGWRMQDEMASTAFRTHVDNCPTCLAGDGLCPRARQLDERQRQTTAKSQESKHYLDLAREYRRQGRRWPGVCNLSADEIPVA